MTEEQKRTIELLRKAGASYKRISIEIGLSESCIKTYWNRQRSSNQCKNCGSELVRIAQKKPKIFCCDQCRWHWWNNHLDLVKRRAMYRHTCETCKKEFYIYGKRERKYCSQDCYIKGRFGSNST